MINLKTIAAAGAVSFLTAVGAHAAVVGVFDAQSDFQAAPIPVLTLDGSATGTVGTFDTTSSRFNFIGGGTTAQSFTINSAGSAVLTVGNLVTADDFSVAKIIVDGTEIDLKANPDVWTYVLVSPTFTLETNFVDNPEVADAGTFDFTLEAAPVPVPAGILLMGTAIAGFGVMRRRKKAVAA